MRRQTPDSLGFLWTDLPKILLNKRKITPPAEREIMESMTLYPNPPTNSIPGASCDSPKNIMDTNINHTKEYNIPTGFNIIFNRIPMDMTPEERAEKPKKMSMIRLEWLIGKYIRQVHKPDPQNASFYILEKTTLGTVLQLDALDRKQLDVMLVPLLLNEYESDDKDLADDEITEKIQQPNQTIRGLDHRRRQVGEAEQPQIVDLVQVNNGENQDDNDGELDEENQNEDAINESH